MTAVNTMSYNGYFARVEFDADNGLFVGRLAGINDVVGFHADSVDNRGKRSQSAVTGHDRQDHRHTPRKVQQADWPDQSTGANRS
jgi:predicted HicB family RNase H-like nuclease